MDPHQLNPLSVSELFQLYHQVLSELRTRGIIRSANNPVADYAEHLCERALALTRAPKSTKGYDASSTGGEKYEVKGRRITSYNRSRETSALRELDKGNFDYLAGVLFHEDFTVWKACLIPHSVVLDESTFSHHTNSWRFHLRDSLWSNPKVVDITKAIQRAQDTSSS